MARLRNAFKSRAAMAALIFAVRDTDKVVARDDDDDVDDDDDDVGDDDVAVEDEVGGEDIEEDEEEFERLLEDIVFWGVCVCFSCF